MKSLLLASCATVSLIGWGASALAGDLGLQPATYDWSGGYVGMNAGMSLDTSSFKSDYQYKGNFQLSPSEMDDVNAFDNSGQADDLGFTAGMLAGYNWQYGNVVLGGEADINYLGFNGTISNDVSGAMSQIMSPSYVPAADKIDYSADWFGTVRGRLGYAMNNVLFYGTGGLAYGQMKIKQKLDANSTDVSNNTESATWQSSVDGYNLGWTLGAGIEYGAGHWVLGAEYLYVDLGTYDWSANGVVFLADPDKQDKFNNVKEKGKADYTFSLARATLKYRF